MTVYPFVIRLGPLELTGYGLMMMVAFLMAGWAMQLDLRRRKLDEEYAADIVIAGVVGGLIGAKIWYVLLTHEWDALLRRGGFVWYGGFLGATAAILINGWRRRVSWRFTVELCSAPLALGYALGRVGCFLVNDDYGIPSSLPWAMKFPHGLPPTTVANLSGLGVRFPVGQAMDGAQLIAVHPTQIYETILMTLAFWWMWRRRDQHHAVGWMLGCYLTFAGMERFLVEFLRAKDDHLHGLGPFTLAQATSIALVVLGVIVLKAWWKPDGSTLSLPTPVQPPPG